MQKQTEMPEALYKLIKYLVTYIKVNDVNDVSDILQHICDINSVFDNVKQHSGYHDYSFSFKEEKFFFYDIYGDEDDDLLFQETEDEIIPIAIGLCIRYKKHIYCIDINLPNIIGGKTDLPSATKIFVTEETIHPKPDFHTGKRAFYHQREDEMVSMRNYEEGYGKEHEEARNWASGPRTLYKLHQLT
jgi:hypothetical protein